MYDPSRLNTICEEMDYQWKKNGRVDPDSIVDRFRITDKNRFADFLDNYIDYVLRNSDEGRKLLDGLDCEFVNAERVLSKMQHSSYAHCIKYSCYAVGFPFAFAAFSTPVLITGFAYGLYKDYKQAKRDILYGNYSTEELSDNLSRRHIWDEERKRSKLLRERLIKKTLSEWEQAPSSDTRL